MTFMLDLAPYLLILTLVLLIAGVLLFWLDCMNILHSLQEKIEDSVKSLYIAFSEKVRADHARRGRGSWYPAPVGAADRSSLLLHDIEIATNRPLLVTFDKVVYVTPKHRREIARYLQSSGFERGVAAEVFARHGYQLVTARH